MKAISYKIDRVVLSYGANFVTVGYVVEEILVFE